MTLYINYHLNLLDPAETYYPQFQYQYETYAWNILKAYHSNSEKEFMIESEKIIMNMYEEEGRSWKRKLFLISLFIQDMKKELDNS